MDMPSVFICYRREDSSGYAGRLHDDLTAMLGEGRVFVDIEAIEAGANFVEAIRSAIATGKILLVVIGKNWISIADANGKRRLDKTNDHVRIEIATALERGMQVIPVLVGGATMPEESELPAPLRELAFRNAFELSDSRWKFDIERLAGTISRQADLPTAEPAPARPRAAAGEPAKKPVRRYVATAVGVAAIAAVVVASNQNGSDGALEPDFFDVPELADAGGGLDPVNSLYDQPSTGSTDFATYGTHTLEAGFRPDPMMFDVTAGGPVAAAEWGGDCVGYVADTPDLILNWSGSSSMLRIFFEAMSDDHDSTLLVVTPDGAAFCNDDSFETRHPTLDIADPLPGRYDIWVGTYESDGNIVGRVSITELSTEHP